MNHIIQETLSDEQWIGEWNKVRGSLNANFDKLQQLFDELDQLNMKLDEDENQ